MDSRELVPRGLVVILHLVVVLYVVVLFKQIPIVVVGNPHSFLVSEYVHY